MKLELKGEKKQNHLCHRRPEGERFKKGFAMSKTKCTPFKALAVKWHKWFANKERKIQGLNASRITFSKTSLGMLILISMWSFLGFLY